MKMLVETPSPGLLGCILVRKVVSARDVDMPASRKGSCRVRWADAHECAYIFTKNIEHQVP